MLKIRKSAFICAALAAASLYGCGGNHNSSGPGTNNNNGGGGTGRPTSAQIEIPNEQNATVFVNMLSGQGRDLGDLYINLENLSIIDTPNQVTANWIQYSPLQLDLSQFQIQYATIDVNMTNFLQAHPLQSSESFDHFTLNPFSFANEQSGGIVPYLLPPNGTATVADPAIAANPIPIRLTAFPGRDTLMPLFLNDAMFTLSNNVETYVTSPINVFQTYNQPPTSDPTTNNKIVAFLSDMVQFDIGSKSYVGTRPALKATGNQATHFYFSGDGIYAMSDDPVNSATGDGTPDGTGGTYEQLTYDPNNPIDGFMSQVGSLPPSGTATPFPTNGFPGTYTLEQANPQDLTGQSKITSLYGRWRNIENLAVLVNTTFDLIIFPNSSETYTPNQPTDCVAIVHNGNVITNLYAGYAYFDGTPGLARLYPLNVLAQVPSSGLISTQGELDYDLSGYLIGSGAPAGNNDESIRTGTFTFDSKLTPSGSTVPAGFPKNSGTFVVFR